MCQSPCLDQLSGQKDKLLSFPSLCCGRHGADICSAVEVLLGLVTVLWGCGSGLLLEQCGWG